jgi:hypothetical protein
VDYITSMISLASIVSTLSGVPLFIATVSSSLDLSLGLCDLAPLQDFSSDHEGLFQIGEGNTFRFLGDVSARIA